MGLAGRFGLKIFTRYCFLLLKVIKYCKFQQISSIFLAQNVLSFYTTDLNLIVTHCH